MADATYTGPPAIAIIGLAGRFPGAPDLEVFWRNLAAGVESITFFDEDDLLAAGVAPADLDAPGTVPANGVLEGIEEFDAAFFGYAPREAELMDPQHRLFLEAAWQALETAGYDPKGCRGSVAVYAGTELCTYLLHNVRPHAGAVGQPGNHQIMIGATQDFLPLRVSYKLGLRGPSVCVQSACSTSLVAVHMACQGLLAGEADLALAGGVTVTVPQVRTYIGSEEGILSPDGHCRPFDADAQGTLAGNGLGVVVLKRLDEALADGDTVRAVIRGSAVNNDGSQKAGFTAPSVQAQAAVIAEAQAVAEVSPGTVTYLEAHGTGTALGDPIEAEALTRAFRRGTQLRGFCALGSVKGNIGHLDAAAGVAGLIKTVLALEHRQIPPSLHVQRPNPAIDFDAGPFFVNTTLRPWESEGGPRRAGVSAFGIGGTNAHVVLEEAPASPAEEASRPHQLLVLSARTPTALRRAAVELADHLEREDGIALADVAHTLRVGRHPFEHRATVVCRTRREGVEALRGDGAEVGRAATHSARVGFLFPGQGTQYPGMGRGLYEAEPVFREAVDECAGALAAATIPDVRDILGFGEDGGAGSAALLDRADLVQPALFTVEYALARLWTAFGVQPAGMLGHSIGEYVAACVSGVLSLEDALRVVAARGRLVHAAPAGAMLAVALGEEDLRAYRDDGLDLAAVNAPDLCVVSGPPGAVEALTRRLAADAVATRRLPASRAFHSRLLGPAAGELERVVGGFRPGAPGLPYVSNLTGDWARAEDVGSPRYWARHLTEPVRFHEGLATLWSACRVLVEVGPGGTLARLARRHERRPPEAVVVSSLPGARESEPEQAAVLRALGRVWAGGGRPDWEAFAGGERRHRVPLPTYPFERRRYWIDPERSAVPDGGAHDPAGAFSVPVWKQAAGDLRARERGHGPWLVLSDDVGLGDRLAGRLRAAGEDVAVVRSTAARAHTAPGDHLVDPRSREDHARVLAHLREAGRAPRSVVHLWSVEPAPPARATAAPAARGTAQAAAQAAAQAMTHERGFDSVVALAQALADTPGGRTTRLVVVSADAHVVTGAEAYAPERATVLGPCRVVGLEHPSIVCANVDVSLAGEEDLDGLAAHLHAELAGRLADATVALRGRRRWVARLEPVRLPAADGVTTLRDGGCYLVTGGLGAVGLAIAEDIAASVPCRLVLVGRRGLPPEREWEDRRRGRRPDGVPPEEHDRLVRTIERVTAMRQRGAHVQVVPADVSDPERMRQVVDEVTATGPINGVVHAAGVPGGGLLRTTTRAVTAAAMAAKLAGTAILHDLLAGTSCDFIALLSSHSSIVGDVGQVDYAAANAFLDAFAQHCHGRGGPLVFAVNYDTWREDGMAVRGLEDLRRRVAGESLPAGSVARQLADAGIGLSNAEGVAAFRRVLASRLPQVVVGTPGHARSAGRRLGAPLPADGGRRGYERPELATRHVAPSTPTERLVAAAWEELLGVSEVGVDDDFLELGGHSLLATQLVARLHDQVGVSVPLPVLFELRTVRDQSRYVELASASPVHGSGVRSAGAENVEEGEL